METGANQSLELDGQRIVSFKDAGHRYTFRLGRINGADWERYFDGVAFTSRNDGKASETLLDVDTAGIEMVKEKLEQAHGYAGEFTARPGWQQKVPARHLLPILRSLREVGKSTNESEQPIDPELMEARLDAMWGVDESGAPLKFIGLVHRFKPTTAEQQRRFLRAGSLTKVVGGSRNGTTVHQLRHRILLAIYDENIQTVDGYTFKGSVFGSADEIRREMDGLHKVRAAEQLFYGAAEDVAGE